MPRSHIPAEVIAAYRSARYQAGSGPDAMILRVDQYSEPLSQLFATSGHRCAAFITACNPFGVRQSPEANRAACVRLRKRLAQYVPQLARIIEGVGLDSAGDWPGEESFLILGLDLETSRALGRDFHQNAIVWVDKDAIPRLILLR
ncbi:DUF3293 domain-containing protein [Nitrosovibrio tenuis]|uniref:DUF3293 domain-containing protein n=1 Tax=Nitrosovibrio tenuis TaxID=1233 RepID=A0A1H7IZG7_9PROT|nr:DUF3293 domain-containing protein [Nitrosovibrio tenuis]SEK67017.1 Protein of unknown function [Nitrosovibrio tenuis]